MAALKEEVTGDAIDERNESHSGACVNMNNKNQKRKVITRTLQDVWCVLRIDYASNGEYVNAISVVLWPGTVPVS